MVSSILKKNLMPMASTRIFIKNENELKSSTGK